MSTFCEIQIIHISEPNLAHKPLLFPVWPWAWLGDWENHITLDWDSGFSADSSNHIHAPLEAHSLTPSCFSWSKWTRIWVKCFLVPHPHPQPQFWGVYLWSLLMWSQQHPSWPPLDCEGLSLILALFPQLNIKMRLSQQRQALCQWFLN